MTIEYKIFCLKTFYKSKFFKIVQATSRRKFNFNTFLNRSLIFKLVQNFEALDACEDGRALRRFKQLPRRNMRAFLTTLHTGLQQCLSLNSKHTGPCNLGILFIVVGALPISPLMDSSHLY